MPKNQLTMSFDIRLTGSIRDNSTDKILSRIDATSGRITFSQVYTTYAQPIIRDAVRAVVAEFTIDQIASSRDAVNQKIAEKLKTRLASTPIALKQVGLARAEYPQVITERKEKAEQRRIDIEQEEANKQVKLIKLQTALEEAKANRAIRREHAEAAAEENRIAAESITPEYIEWKKLEVLSEMAKSGSTTFVPVDALGTVGLSNKVFGAR